MDHILQMTLKALEILLYLKKEKKKVQKKKNRCKQVDFNVC